MTDILDQICEAKWEHVAACKETHPLALVEAAAREVAKPRGFVKRLRKAVAGGGYGLIAEIKRASPSKGLIREDYDPPALARAYEAGGATCLSVLTDAPFFKGNDADLIEAWAAVDLPVLRKDFMIDPYQIVESRALGADCVLLIMAALDDAEARELEATAVDYGLDVLAEVHDADELARALRLRTELIGFNNRDLKTFEVDLGVTEALVADIPDDRIVVSESGLHAPADLARLSAAGVHCFLVGESLMREDDVEAATRALLSPLAGKTAGP
ncbi:MAG: indole-3-glycerol phosphate synthase TrpC [Rhodospirillales bacterium]|nr:indole-3-glycerol phosphate synthase TrpC [Rhodospirillales bacterium]